MPGLVGMGQVYCVVGPALECLTTAKARGQLPLFGPSIICVAARLWLNESNPAGGGPMKKTLLQLLFLLLLVPVPAFGLEIGSVYPEVAFVGTAVTIIGGPFSDQVLVSLSGQTLRPQLTGDRQLVFLVPPLPPGEHALFLFEGEASSPQTFNLLIELPPPQIDSIAPGNVDVCSSSDLRKVRLFGSHIQNSARLLFDEKVIPFMREGDGSLSFLAPPVRAGSYGLQVVNPDGKKSLPHTLWISNVPEIESVSVGGSFVNSYQMIISGKNFFHNSVLLVIEYPGGFADLPPRQRFIPAQGGGVFHGNQSPLRLSDTVRYQDCHTLIYVRYPVSGQSRRIDLRVGNPDGKQTSGYEVSLP